MRQAIATAVLLCPILVAAAGREVSAQTGKPYVLRCETKEFADERYTCKGQVEFQQEDIKIYAEELEYFEAEERGTASGNVVFSQGRNQISADRADFNTRTRLGTFYVASGIAEVQPPPPAPATPGAFVAPQRTGVATEVYFFGEVVKKVGPKKYEITNGGFTPCVQPTPRWELHAGKVTLNVDEYVFLRNSLFDVKGIPVLYLPIMYYPINKDGRATGFLMPTWGTSSLNGQFIGNQFFWAIGRSHDATFMHDWYSRLGQGVGGEYRYNIGSGTGRLTTYLLNRTAQSYASAERSVTTIGSANQALPHGLRGRADLNYFTSIASHQTFMTNIADFSQSRRSYGGNVAGSRGHYALNATYQHQEWFNSVASSGVTGSTPLVSLSKSEQPLLGATSPLYLSFGSEYAHLQRETTTSGLVSDDRTLNRIDVAPRLRYPFKRWPWMNVSSSVSWRDTFYSRSQDPLTKAVIGDNLNRQFFTFQSDITGPTFNRIWDTPGNGYAERFKHTIEPFVGVQRTTAINNFDRVVAGVDGGIIGGVTSYAYGVNNRLYAKRRLGSVSQAQEIVSVGVSQTYYTDSRAAQFDPGYGTSFTGVTASHFSPVKLAVLANPDSRFSGSLRAEIDATYLEVRTLSVGGRHTWAGGFNDISWNQRFRIAGLAGFSDPGLVSRALSATSNAHTGDNRYGGTYTFTYDAVRSTLLQQTVQGYYNAQCCGFGFQYSRVNYPSNIIASNQKFLFSVTLAGLGSFSPFDGGMSSVLR